MPFLQLALNLSFAIFLVFVFIKLHEINYWIVPVLTVALLAGGMFLSTPASIQFWLPGSTSSFILSAFFIYTYLAHPRLYICELSDPLPDRKTLREPLTKTPSIQDRQEIYIKIVRELSRIYTNWEKKVTPSNTRYLVLALMTMFLINYGVFAYFYLDTEVFKEFLFAGLSAAAQVPEVKEGDFTLIYESIRNYYPFITFVLSALIYFIMFPLVRKFLTYRKIQMAPFGNAVFFRLPDILVWFYIISLGVFIYLYRTSAEAPWMFIPKNVFLIFSFAYILQAASTFWMYFQIRVLPGALILSALLILGMFFPTIFIFLVLLLLLFGVFEFWFNFRKKALQPKLLSNDAF